MIKNSRWLIRSALGMSMLVAVPSHAQTGLPAPDQTPLDPAPADTSPDTPGRAPQAGTADGQPAAGGKVEEIIVTAQRRSENLQRVPIAVTAVTSAALTRNAIKDVTDLTAVVPGLNITNEIGFVTSQLRGVGSTLLSVGYENPVAIYVDGVYYASPSASNVNFSNIERVEVLKGPQGTLFGRNATGGLINIITKDPSHEFGGAVSASYGNYRTVTGDAYISGGLTDDIAIDLAVQGSHQGDGWGTNIFLGRDNYKINHDLSARSKLVYKTDRTRIALSGDYSDYKNSLSSEVLLPGTYSAYAGGPIFYPGRYDTNTNVPHSVDGYNWGLSLQAEQDLGSVRLRSISAFRRSRLVNIVDIDETPLSALAFRMAQRDRQFSQELQLLSKGSGPFNWVLGAYYFNGLGKWDPFRITLGAPLAPFPINVSSYDRIGTRSLAGYAQGTYALTSDTRLTLGARYTDEKRSRVGLQTTTAAASLLLPVAPGVFIPITAGDPVGPPLSFPKASLKYKRVTFRAALDHDFSSNILGYASFNRGFKSGGYNPAIYDQALIVGTSSYGPERLDAYEIGLKSTLADRRIRLNVAAFYYNYSNLQLPFIIETTVLTINGARARIYGVDGDLEFRISEALRFTGGFQFLHDRYVSFPNAPIGSVRGGTRLTVGSAKGNELNSVPSVTLNGGFDYTIGEIAGGSVNVGFNAAYKNGYYFNPDNIQRQGAFVLLNSTIKWTSSTGLSVGLYGKNLGNVRYIGAQAEQSSGDISTQWAAPRTYGLTAGYKF